MQAPGASAGSAQAWGQGGRTERAGLRHGAQGAHGYEDGRGQGQRRLCGVKDLSLPLLSVSSDLIFTTCLLEF